MFRILVNKRNLKNIKINKILQYLLRFLLYWNAFMQETDLVKIVAKV